MMRYHVQKMFIVESWVFLKAYKMLPSPRSRQIDPSAGFLKCFSRWEYMSVYCANFRLASSRSLSAFSRRPLRTANWLALLSSTSARVRFCCAWSFSKRALKLAESYSISLAWRCCSWLSPASRTLMFFFKASISSLRMRSWSPEWSAWRSSFSFTYSSEVSSCLFWRVRAEILALSSALCCSDERWREARSSWVSFKVLWVRVNLSVTSSSTRWLYLALMLCSFLVRSSSFCCDLSSA